MISFTCFSPDGDQALFDANIDGSGLRQLTPFSFEVGTKADWSPDSRRIMFITQAGGTTNTATIRPDGTGLTYVTNNSPGGPSAFGNSYSPDAPGSSCGWSRTGCSPSTRSIRTAPA
jgi:Tol biopolymer transport system component